MVEVFVLRALGIYCGDVMRKAAVVGEGMLILFVFGEHIHLVPAVTAIMGATALLIWIRPESGSKPPHTWRPTSTTSVSTRPV